MVTDREGRDLAARLGTVFVKTSAKLGYNIEELLDAISQRIADGRTEHFEAVAAEQEASKKQKCSIQ